MPSEAERPMTKEEAQERMYVLSGALNSLQSATKAIDVEAEKLTLLRRELFQQFPTLDIRVKRPTIEELDRILNAEAAAPSPASLDEAVRVVDGLTCKWCGWGYDRITLDTNQHMLSRENGGKFEPCTKQGRAVIDALQSKGFLK